MKAQGMNIIINIRTKVSVVIEYTGQQDGRSALKAIL